MNYLVITVSLFFSLCSFAEGTEDMSKILKASQCVPVRDKEGKISSFKCDGPLGEKMKQDKRQNQDSPKQAMDLYNSLKNAEASTVEETKPAEDVR